MTQEEKWNLKYKEVMTFIEINKRNPSRYDPEERGLYCHWIHHNRKLLNAGAMKAERVEIFSKLLELMENYRRKNQYV